MTNEADEILVVGSVALDTVETPFGRVEDVLGGSAVFFSAAASVHARVGVVGVVGDDYPLAALDFLDRGRVDLSGVEIREGKSFRWGGSYGYDLNTCRTLFTELGVFADFRPSIPARLRMADWVFLANIDPRLQLEVLDQVESPRFVACDTMNYWIDGQREALLSLLGHIDMLLVNDGEARQLSGDHNLATAARWIQNRGPEHVVIKKGEHGALLFSGETIFSVPGFPLEEVYDPTGAGDAFAGGVLGHLASEGSLETAVLKRAIVHGCALGSFACEAFGPERLGRLTVAEVGERVCLFRELTAFDEAPVSG
ncbi:MAG: PfkB family carbohydrate kinase [Gemmatimonadota bacterium]